MELPESVLLCLFPNGVVLSPQRQSNGDGDSADEDEDIYYVDVRCPFPCLGRDELPPPIRAGPSRLRSERRRDKEGRTQNELLEALSSVGETCGRTGRKNRTVY
jgi:hypothetical protein